MGLNSSTPQLKGALRAKVIVACAALILSVPAFAQETARKVKNKVDPVYPDLARKNAIHGSTRVQLLVAPDGRVKDVKVLGGNPVLVDATVSAVRKWKYEAAAEESTIVVRIDFNE